MPNLRSLDIEERDLRIQWDDVGDIADLLSSHFASAPNLESIRVFLAWTWPALVTVNVAKVIGRADTWNQLDEKLAAAACFKRLDINMHYLHDLQATVDVLKSHFAGAFEWWTPENAFPILSSKSDSIVRLTFSLKHVSS